MLILIQCTKDLLAWCWEEHTEVVADRGRWNNLYYAKRMLELGNYIKLNFVHSSILYIYGWLNWGTNCCTLFLIKPRFCFPVINENHQKYKSHLLMTTCLSPCDNAIKKFYFIIILYDCSGTRDLEIGIFASHQLDITNLESNLWMWEQRWCHWKDLKRWDCKCRGKLAKRLLINLPFGRKKEPLKSLLMIRNPFESELILIELFVRVRTII